MKQIVSMIFMLTTFYKSTCYQKQKQGKDLLIYEDDEFFFSTTSNSLFFDSDESNIAKIKTIDYKFIEYAFSMEFTHTNKLINLIMLNSVKFENLKGFCICQLLQSEKLYFIVCNDGILINKKTKQLEYQKGAKKYQINLLTNFYEQCKEMKIWFNNQIIITCSSFQKLKVFTINLNEQQSTIAEVSLEFDSTKCSQKIFHFNQLLLFVFYNCDNWKIIDITTSEIKVIFDQELISKLNLEKNQLNIQYLSEIFICQNTIYLIEFTNYHIFLYEEGNFIYNSTNFEEGNIRIITFTKYCSIRHMILVTELQSIKTIQFRAQQKKIFLNKDMQDEIQIINEFLFLRKENQLNLILCQFLNQDYQILSSKLYFFDQHQSGDSLFFNYQNLFFQIDEIKKIVIFYEYQRSPQILQLKKQYLQQILNFNLFSNFEDSAAPLRILYSDNMVQEIHSFKQFIQNDCNYPLQTQFLKIQSGLPKIYEMLQLKQQNDVEISIIDEETLQIYDSGGGEVEAVFWIDQFGQNLVEQQLFLTKEYKIIFSFKNTTKRSEIYQFNRSHTQILKFSDSIAIINFKTNQLIIPSVIFDTVWLKEVNFDKKIVKATQWQQYLIISFIDNSYHIFNILIKQQLQINEQVLKFGIPQCIFIKNNYSIMQFEQILIFQNNTKIHIIEFENASIYSISYEGFGPFLKAIHNVEDKIIIFYYNGASLDKISELKLTTSKFIRPIILSQSGDYVSIASLTNQQKSIVILRVLSTIKIIKIKFCSNFNFTLQNKILLYFNQKEEIQIFYLLYYKILIQSMPVQTDYQNKYQINFLIKYQEFNQTIQIQKSLDVILQNNCNKLFKKQDKLEVFNTRNILNLDQLFYGSIQNISSNINNSIIVSGPLQIAQTLEACNYKSMVENYCINQYMVIFKSIRPYFSFKCIQRMQYCDLFQITQLSQIQIEKQKFLSNYQMQLNIIRYEGKCLIHLFEVDHLNFKLIEISLQQIIEIPKGKDSLEVMIRDLLIKIQIRDVQMLIYVGKNRYKKYNIENNIVDFDVNNNQKDLFLLLEQFEISERNYSFGCQIVSFENDEKKIQKSFILGNDLAKLVTFGDQNINLFQNKFQLLNWELFQSYVEFNLFFVQSEFSYEVNIINNFLTGQQQFKIIRILKNPMQELNLKLSFIDTNYLIIYSLSHNYIYNLTYNQSIYNYIGQVNQFDNHFFPLNITHQILKNSQTFNVIEFSYQLFIKTYDNQIKGKNILIISNQVSSEELEVILSENQNTIVKQETEYSFKFYVIMLIIILIMALLIRRKRIRQRMYINNRISELYPKDNN